MSVHLWKSFLHLNKWHIWSFISQCRVRPSNVIISTFQLTYCWSSSSIRVKSLHVTINSTLVYCYWCAFAHYHWGILIPIITPTTRGCCLIDPLCHWLAVMLSIHVLGLTILFLTILSQLLLLGWSLMWMAFLNPVKAKVYKLNLVPNRKSMPKHTNHNKLRCSYKRLFWPSHLA